MKTADVILARLKAPPGEKPSETYVRSFEWKFNRDDQPETLSYLVAEVPALLIEEWTDVWTNWGLSPTMIEARGFSRTGGLYVLNVAAVYLPGPFDAEAARQKIWRSLTMLGWRP